MLQSTDEQFKSIYNTYHSKVYRLCLGYTGDSAEASDLAQEVFIRVWENLAGFRGDAQVSTWIYRIAVNTCLLNLRKTKKELQVSLDGNIKIAEEVNEKESQIRILHKCISQLEEADRLIITLMLEEIPYREIAEITSVSEGNLRVKIHRIKQQLSELYAKHERL